MAPESRRVAGILWRAGHAHAGVLLILSLVILRYVDETSLLPTTKRFVRVAAPSAAILLPLAYFLSVLSPEAQEPNPLGLLTLGVGLIRSR